MKGAAAANAIASASYGRASGLAVVPRKTRAPAPTLRSKNSATTRVLPIPASPHTNAAVPAPPAADSQPARNMSSVRVRPTKGNNAVDAAPLGPGESGRASGANGSGSPRKMRSRSTVVSGMGSICISPRRLRAKRSYSASAPGRSPIA
jgi:hypothetical protein